MELVAFRHGPAADKDPRRWPGDGKRPLSSSGARETRRAAKGLAAWFGKPDRIASSPLVRARATAEFLVDSYPRAPRLEVWEELSSGGLAPPILERIRSIEGRVERVVLVGHEPTLSAFLALALTGESVPFGRLSKAGAALLTFPKAVAAGAAKLEWVATRKQLSQARR